MSTRLGEWPSNAESDRHFACEGITQQPGPFYNGNFSSSIWGNPPTPPLWRDTPPTSYGSCSKAHGHATDKHKTEPLTSLKFQPSDEEGERASNLTGNFSFGLHAGLQDLASSPFTFGFPGRPSAPSSSHVGSESMKNVSSFPQSHFPVKSAHMNGYRRPISGSSTMFDKSSNQCFTKESACSLEELSNSWSTMLQAQAGLFASLDGPLVHSLAGGQALARDGQQPGHGNLVVDAEMHRTSLLDQQSANNFAESSGTSPDLAKSESAPFLFTKKDDFGTFVFGSSPASGTSVNVGFSQQKGFRAPSSGSKPTSSLASTRGRKHGNVIRPRSSAATMSRDFQPRPSKCNLDGSCSSYSFFKFTMGASDGDCSQCPEPSSKDRNNAGSVSDPALCQASSFFPGAASAMSKDRDLLTSLNVRVTQNSEWQHAQAFDKQFSAWNPFPSREENSFKDCNFTWAASSKSTLYSNISGRKHEKRETSAKAAFTEELPKTSMETNRASEESKLTEFDLNSPGKLSAEDLRERAAKGKFGEEIKRQKENQEPNFSFGSQKGSRPFIFGSSRTTCNTKHTTPNADDMIRNDRSSKGTKDSKVLEHLIAKLGERMENLGKCHDNLSNQETVFGGIKNFNAFEGSSSKFGKDQEEKGKATYRSEDSVSVFEKRDTVDRSIDEIREQLAKLGRLDDQDKFMKDRTGAVSYFSNGSTDGNAMEHAVKELREQISKLGCVDDKRQERNDDTAKFSASKAEYRDSYDSSSILRAVEELSEQIAKMGRAVRDKNIDEHSSFRLQQCDTITKSVEELRERIKTLGKVDEEGNTCNRESKLKDEKKVEPEAFVFAACDATARKDSDSTHFSCLKAFVNNSRGGSIGRDQFNPFTNVSYANIFPSNKAVSSSSSPTANPFMRYDVPETCNGTKFFSFERPSASSSANAGSSIGGFEFQGTKTPLRTTTQRKSGRACPILKSHEKANLARSRRAAHFISTAHGPGSPMDFSPCADKAAPSSPVIVCCDAGQASVHTSHVPKLDEVESMNVEEIRIATANLTVGNDQGSCKCNQKGSRLSGRTSDETNPFVFRQTKGTWKRAPRKGTEGLGFKSQATSGPQMAYCSSFGIDKGTASSFSSLADPNRVGAREKLQSNTLWNPSFRFSFNEMEKAATERTAFPLKFGDLDKEQNRETPASSTATKSVAAEQTCEQWRLRGNQAYVKGDYEKAEDCYTRGAGSVLPGDTSESCMRASMLCFSNRAATRMAVGRMREALADCKQAMMLDSSFLRVRLRAASCHLALGESKAAAALFTECWTLAKEKSSSDMKLMEESINGVRKSQNADNLLERSSNLLKNETFRDASAALQLIDEALTVSPYSEAIQDLKAQALFLLRRFEDVVQLCQKTLPTAEENHGAHHHDKSLRNHSIFLNLWRWRMCGKAYFQLGRLDDSLSLLTKYEEATCGLSSNEAANTESMTTTLTLVRDLLLHKAAGNEAFQAGRHADALEHYTAALSCNSESRPYNAVCFCNRAAASQALGHIADAIADCSRAIVLDSCYAKAISRRATLHEIIRDFGQTCNDLQRLVTLLEGQEALSKSPKTTRAVSKNAQDLRQARERLEKARKEMKKDCVVDHYLILGLDVSASASDVKKAYRKAALKHHPDKAGQFLVRGENGDDGSLWKEAGDEVRRDAERLFKIIGESYAILSDPTKRTQYDLEHQMSRARNNTFPGYCSTEDYCSPAEKSGRRHHESKDGWNGQSPRYQRWQNGPDAAQPDTYSEKGTRDSSRSRERRHRGKRSEFFWEEL